MDIVALSIATVYLLVVVVAGFIGALLALVWLFGEAPGEGMGTGRETVGGSPSTERFGSVGTPAASVGPARPEDEAA